MAVDLIRAGLSRRANPGFCLTCDQRTVFVEHGHWLREDYRCVLCGSLPRHRALMRVLNALFPAWPDLRLYEASPGGPAYERIRRRCARYTASHFYPNVPLGSSVGDLRCENLEALTFPDATFDLVITQDVFEHVLQPDDAFAQIARILKPGGAHLFTVPYFRGRKSLTRAVPSADGVRHLVAPDYHGDPINPEGALVVTEWGDDLPERIFHSGGMLTTILEVRDRALGLDGKFLEVFVSRKTPR